MELQGIEAAMYLRKSRAEDGQDTDAILRRHRETLTEYASRTGLRVMETFQEVKSGESLYARPEMLRLLEEVEAGRFGAVLCMDIDRLSRGGTRDRGLIWETFKDAGTLIVTPSKVYDLSTESDEIMTEFYGLFASMELRQIKKRLARGRERVERCSGVSVSSAASKSADSPGSSSGASGAGSVSASVSPSRQTGASSRSQSGNRSRLRDFNPASRANSVVSFKPKCRMKL